MKKTNTQTGITLLALIITIIILLMLVFITISMVIDENIFTYAKTAVKNYQIDEEKEQITIAYDDYKTQLEEGEQTPELVIKGALVVADETSGWEITFEKTKHEYTLNLDGSIDIGIAEKWDGTTEIPHVAEDNSWHIYNGAQLKYFADFVNGKLTEEEKGNLNITKDTIVYLEADLDLGARANEEGEKIQGTEWTPVGIDTSHVFVGTFEGNHHYIKGVYVKMSGDFAGLFGILNNISIQNLTIKNSYIEGENYSGGIVGALRTGKIENCHNINTTVKANENQVGGIVGIASAETIVKQCSNTGEVIGGGCAGGIIGNLMTSGNISNCYNQGKISGSNTIGGVVGQLAKLAIMENCYNMGSIIGEFQIGGLIGYAQLSSSTLNSYNGGEIIATNQKIGGCIGAFSGNIDGCYNTGKITAIGNSVNGAVGGVVGAIMKNNEESISNCYNMGIIESQGLYTGGVLGYVGNSTGKIENSYNAGDIKGTEQVGGIIGRNASTFTVKNCYNKGQVEGTETDIGAVIGQQQTNTSKISNLYYNIDNLPAIGNMEAPDTVQKVEDNLNSFEEFLNWIQEKNKE